MPSGPKRRKAAAKRKKDEGSNFNTSSTTSLENDDPKIVEGDDVEVSSPVSEEKRGDSSVRSIVDEKGLEEHVVKNDGDDDKKVVVEDYDGGVVVDREVNVEEESESKNGGAVYVESDKNGHNRSSSSSNSSSSSRSRSISDDEAQVVEESELADESQVVEKNSFQLEDESRVIEKNSLELEDESEVESRVPEKGPLESQVVESGSLELEDSEKLNNEGNSLIPEATNLSDYMPTEDPLYNSIVETEPLADSVKLDETVLEKVIPFAQNFPLETSIISDVVEMGADEKDEHFTDYAKVDHATDDAKDDHDTDNASTEEAHYISVMETAPIVDSIKLDEPVHEKVIPITGTNEKDEQLLPSLVESENNVTFGSLTDIEAEKVEDKASLLSYENEGGSLLSYENEGGSSSANVPITGTRNCEEHIKYPEVSESSEKQPLIARPPQQVQKTSWKSCCGLFDW